MTGTAADADRGGTPEVSVLVPVRDGERFLGEALDSILGQDFRDLELVVLDDGSTDSTPRILAEYAERDPRVLVHRERGDNLSIALNRGVGLCRGRFIARLDADDVSIAGRIGAQARALEADPELVLVGGQGVFIDEEGREFGVANYPLHDAELRERLTASNPFIHSAAMIRRFAFDTVGGYRENFSNAEDLDMWLRLAEVGRIANLPDPVVKYRIHGSQVSLANQRQQAVHAEAARMSARARRAGRSDPFEGRSGISAEMLTEMGVEPERITGAAVRAQTWLARTTDRAGHHDTATELFAGAFEQARSPSGSRALVAEVRRSVAQRHLEQGHRLRGRLAGVRAALEERR